MRTYTISGSYCDLYELTMGQTYFLEGRHHVSACFDYFFRKIPDHGGYVLFAGLHDLLQMLEALAFTEEDLYFLKQHGFHHSFLEFLKSFSFRGQVFSVPEGEVVFPNAPILRIEGSLLDAQLIESLLLNTLNFESLVATKASRIRQVAGGRFLSDFGLRRAHGPGAVLASRAAIVGGFDATSNVYAAEMFGLPVSGTMAHSFVASFDSELEAFRAFARSSPQDCTFLADTYDTLKSGIPNAITVAKEMEAKGCRAGAIRLDSGDLALLSKAARALLNEAGLGYIKIVVSNQLDEYVIKSLLEQGAPIDAFGVGTRLATGQPDAALDGVYKLVMADGAPRLKVSEDPEKIILPGTKQIYRLLNENGWFYGADVVALEQEAATFNTMFYPFERNLPAPISGLKQETLLQKVMDHGKPLIPFSPASKIAAFAQSRLALLPAAYKTFNEPHQYKVGISKGLLELRSALMHKYKK